MQISQLLGALAKSLDFSATGTQSRPAADVAGGSAPPASPSSSLPSDAALRDVAARFDIREISPREFSDLISQLRDAGLLSQDDISALLSLRAELDQSQVGADDPVNLLDFVRDKLRDEADQFDRNLGKQGQQTTTSSAAQRQLDLLERLAIAHAGSADDPLDALV